MRPAVDQPVALGEVLVEFGAHDGELIAF